MRMYRDSKKCVGIVAADNTALMRMQGQLQTFFKVCLALPHAVVEIVCRRVYQSGIVNIPAVVVDFKFALHVMVKTVQIEIGEQLTIHITQDYATSRLGILHAFLRRYACKKFRITDKLAIHKRITHNYLTYHIFQPVNISKPMSIAVYPFVPFPPCATSLRVFASQPCNCLLTLSSSLIIALSPDLDIKPRSKMMRMPILSSSSAVIAIDKYSMRSAGVCCRFAYDT